MEASPLACSAATYIITSVTVLSYIIDYTLFIVSIYFGTKASLSSRFTAASSGSNAGEASASPGSSDTSQAGEATSQGDPPAGLG